MKRDEKEQKGTDIYSISLLAPSHEFNKASRIHTFDTHN